MDPQRFQGTIYKAANWIYVGDTKGFRRTRQGYSATADSPKMVFVKPLTSDAQALLSGPILDPAYRTRGPRIMLSALHMQSLPDFFADIPDGVHKDDAIDCPLCWQLHAGATLCGMPAIRPSRIGPTLDKKPENVSVADTKTDATSYRACRSRDVLIRVDPVHLDHALQRWSQAYGRQDESLAIDGKTMCNAVDDQGYQTHIMSAIGHQSKTCYTQKK